MSSTSVTMNRRAAVTGAASGIGAATARRLQAQGWRVAAMTAVKGGVIFLLERPVVVSGPDDDDQE